MEKTLKNKYMKRIVFITIVLLAALNVKSQQLPQLSLISLEPIVFNPAVAGSNSYPEVKLHHRSQWVGYGGGAPVTSMLTYHNELNTNMGLGGYIINDSYGAYRRTALNLAYAYHLSLKKVFLGFGLSANLMQYALNGDELTIHDIDDGSFAQGISDKRILPDANFGMYLYNKNFYLGFSAMQLFGSDIKFDLNSPRNALMPLVQHYYITGGYSFIPTKGVMLEPSFLFSKAPATPAQIGGSVKMEYKTKFTSGVSYRYKDAVTLLAGFRYQRYFIGYSYDILTSKLRNSNSGSHEIVISFNWPFTPDTKPLYDLKGSDRGQLRKRLM